MKTLHLINIGDDTTANLLNGAADRLLTSHPKLQEGPLCEALHQYGVQALLFGYVSPDNKDAGYGFYENSEQEGRMVTSYDPVGTISVRIDYDPNYSPQLDGIALEDYKGHEEDPVTYFRDLDEAALFDKILWVVGQTGDVDRNPNDAGVDHVRVSIVVQEGRVYTRSYWPTQAVSARPVSPTAGN